MPLCNQQPKQTVIKSVHGPEISLTRCHPRCHGTPSIGHGKDLHAPKVSERWLGALPPSDLDREISVWRNRCLTLKTCGQTPLG